VDEVPSSLIIIYRGDFTGTSQQLGPGRYAADAMGIGNNELSSIKIPAGFRVTLFEDEAFEGRSLILTGDTRAEFFLVNNFNNITSSMIVEAIPMVTIYEGDYTGTSKSLEPGKYTIEKLGIGNDDLSSVRVPPGYR